MSLPEASKRVYTSPVHSSSSSNSSSSGNVQGDELSKENKEVSKQDMSFVYSRESDRFGEGCEFSDSLLSEVFRLKESDSMNKRRKHSPFVQKELADCVQRSSNFIAYNHNPKVYHPLYHTTATEYGSKKPSEATFQKRTSWAEPTIFTIFQSYHVHNEGLDAAITKSKVHYSLV